MVPTDFEKSSLNKFPVKSSISQQFGDYYPEDPIQLFQSSTCFTLAN